MAGLNPLVQTLYICVPSLHSLLVEGTTSPNKLLFFWFSQPREKDIPLDCNGMVIPSNTSFLDTCEAMEDLVIEGLVRKGGMSNLNHEQLETLLNKPGLRFKPVTNQVSW